MESHRQRPVNHGLRPIRIWVPDVRAPEFAAEAHRQSVLVGSDARDADEQAFVDAISVDWDDDTERTR